MAYRELAPPPALRPWLACLWERHADGVPTRVVPDGCIDVVWTEGAGTSVVGPNTTAFLVPLAVGTRVVGARLRPGAASALLGVVPEALRDAQVPVTDAMTAAGARLVAALDDQPRPLDALRDALLALAPRATPPDPLVGAAVARLADPGVTIAGLGRELAVSERQLRRRVRAEVGYGPKRLGRVLRLERALAAARAGDELVRAALDAGYADQAHLATDCRALAGVPPSALLQV
jgi:AraC-like DNA-binding protein